VGPRPDPRALGQALAPHHLAIAEHDWVDSEEARLGQATAQATACRRTDSPVPRVCEAHDVWRVDFKGQFETRDGRLCYPLTVMDAASRYLLACTAFVEPTTENVKKVFVELFAKHGLPKAIARTTVSRSRPWRRQPGSRNSRLGGRASGSSSNASTRANRSRTDAMSECISP
jgi:transposase InsO family protein